MNLFVLAVCFIGFLGPWAYCLYVWPPSGKVLQRCLGVSLLGGTPIMFQWDSIYWHEQMVFFAFMAGALGMIGSSFSDKK